MEYTPSKLVGTRVRLEPIEKRHLEDLYPTTRESYSFLRPSVFWDSPTFEDFCEKVQLGWSLERTPFIIMNQDNDAVLGSTSLGSIDFLNRKLEIGWTWLAGHAQRMGINTEAKWLLLRHAFEDLGMIRVQLMTHHLNTQSQRAIEKLGAVREGFLRNHMVYPDGHIRHTVVYSIVDAEWPEVKERLSTQLKGYPDVHS
ncbi:MAG: GNAT family protein [Deinococcaceae bacterium]